MLYILWGEEDFSIQERLQQIKSELGDFTTLASNFHTLEGQKLSLKELQATALAAPFLAPKRLVVITGLLERFQMKDKSVKSKKSGASSGDSVDEVKLFSDCISALPESTVLVLIDHLEIKSNPSKVNPLFMALADKAQTMAFPILSGVKLGQWIQARVTQYGGAISQQATNILMQIIGGDLYTLSNELNKLVTFTAGRRIEEKDVHAVVAAAQDARIFEIVDAVIDHRAGLAEQVLFKLFQNGVAAQQILTLLARQIQMLVQIKDMKTQKKPISEIQTRLGLNNPYVWSKTSARAEKYTLDKLREIYNYLLATDLAIKTGKLESDLAMYVLVAELCAL